MADIRALRSYLVSLGFSVNTSQAAQFNNAIKTASQVVHVASGNIAANLAKMSMTVVASIEAVAISFGALAEKAATADQKYRLFGERMFMDSKHAKTLKVSLDALGVSLEEAAFDPEVNRRLKEMNALQGNRLMPMLGADFPQTMIQLRDALTEMTKFRVEALYFRDLVVKQVFQGLGGEKLTATLRSWNEYILQNIPKWATTISTYLVPVLKDAWHILKDIWGVAKSFAELFTKIVGLLSGDPALQGTVSFEKFALALEKCANQFAKVFHWTSMFAGTFAGAAIGGSIGGLPGMAIGAATGGLFDAARDIFGSKGDATGTAGAGIASTSNDAKSLAAQVGGTLGIPPNVIYSQWAHETGNFTNRGATSLNNLAGIRMPGSKEYRKFDSLSDFGSYYSGLLSRRYPNALGAQTIDQLATALKGGGYFEDSLSNYERGMHSFEGAYGAGAGNNSVSIGDIHINQPGASAEEITSTITGKIQDRQRMITSSNLAELRAMY